MDTNVFPNADKLKSFWQRPGGKFGIVIGLGLAVLVGWYVLPILTTVVWNTVNFGIALAALGLLIYALSHRKLRLSAYYAYEILMKKLVGIVIELDPFIIAEDYIQDMDKQRENLNVQALEVDTQKEKTAMKIQEKHDDIRRLMTKAQVAREKNMLPELGNATRQIGRLEDYIKQLTPILNNLTQIGDYLTEVYKNSAYMIEDAKNELEVKKDLYKSVTSGNKALTSALKIFKGDPEKKLLVEQSMEYLKDDIAAKLANMKKAITYSSDFMRSIDLDNATYEQAGLNMLNHIQQEKQLDANKTETFSVDAQPEAVKVKTNYNDLLS